MIKEKIDNSRYPHAATIARIEGGDNFSDENGSASVLYEGCCHLFQGGRGFSKRSVESDRLVSIPIRFNKWENTPKVNDIITVAVNDTLTEEGLITDVIPDNNRTQVYFNLNKL